MDRALKNLAQYFERFRAPDITPDAIARYIDKRLAVGAANATINRELTALRRAMNLAVAAGKLAHVPRITNLREDNARKGFVSREQFETLQRELPTWLQSLVEAAYITGWRKSELVGLTWSQVDFAGGWLRLEPGTTKNREGRQFPLIAPLRCVLEAQRARTSALERKQHCIVPFVFHDAGRRILSFRKRWTSACKRAGVPGLLFHDLRRTAVRNLVRAGVSQTVAMRLVGHRTDSVFRRYAIVDEVLLAEGAAKLSALLTSRVR